VESGLAEQPRFERNTQSRVIVMFIDKARSDCLGCNLARSFYFTSKQRDFFLPRQIPTLIELDFIIYPLFSRC